MQITVSYQEYVVIVENLCIEAKLCRFLNISSKVASRKATRFACALTNFEFLWENSNR